MTAIHNGDCAQVIADKIPAQSVNLIVTSPPYADRRASNYGGIHPDHYVDWFLPKGGSIQAVPCAGWIVCAEYQGKGRGWRKTSICL